MTIIHAEMEMVSQSERMTSARGTLTHKPASRSNAIVCGEIKFWREREGGILLAAIRRNKENRVSNITR